MSRLFVALKIPDNILDEVISIRKNLYGEGELRKWEAKEKLHLTLKFLGETNKQSEIRQQLTNLITVNSEFECQLNTFGLFYRNENPSILWASFKQNDNLHSLFRKIDESMTSLGFEKEKRKFKPHLTILRNKSRKDLQLLEAFKGYDLSPLTFIAKEIHLIQSELKPEGSVYTTIEKYELYKTEE